MIRSLVCDRNWFRWCFCRKFLPNSHDCCIQHRNRIFGFRPKEAVSAEYSAKFGRNFGLICRIFGRNSLFWPRMAVLAEKTEYSVSAKIFGFFLALFLFLPKQKMLFRSYTNAHTYMITQKGLANFF